VLPSGRTGALNVIDLANRDSCAFLALDDIGRVYDDGSFEVLGRMDGTDIRGCNLMWER
ncbi:MAG: acyl transferase, partial [Flavobacteriales bacterium]